MSEQQIAIGDYVRVQDDLATRAVRGVVFQVVSISGSVATLDPTTGGRGIRAYLGTLEKTERPAALDKGTPEPLFIGALVTISGRGWKEPPGGIYVVVKVEPNGQSRVFPLGGDERGRYWRSIPRDYVTVIDPKRVSIADAD